MGFPCLMREVANPDARVNLHSTDPAIEDL